MEEVYGALCGLSHKESNEIIGRFVGTFYDSSISFTICGRCNGRFIEHLYVFCTIACTECGLILCGKCAGELEQRGVLSFLRRWRGRMDDFVCKYHLYDLSLFEKLRLKSELMKNEIP